MAHDPHSPTRHPHCCPSCGGGAPGGLTRRGFLGSTAALGGLALANLSWAALGAEAEELSPPPRRPLVVKPILVYEIPRRRAQTSWRSWGGIQTEADAQAEAARIKAELEKLQATADFPVTFLPLGLAKERGDVAAMTDRAAADAVLLYAAGGPREIFNDARAGGKDAVFFIRHRSGPAYLWYEIVSPRYLRGETDHRVLKGIDDLDVVVDSQEEIAWRLRALCGLRNTLGSTIVAVGGPDGWSTPAAPQLARDRFQLDIRTVNYDELGGLIKDARADKAAVDRARRRADEYLNLPGTTLQTKRAFVDNAFLLEGIFRALIRKAGARAMTINSCMGTIMPLADTTACLPLSTLNDAGYLAFCESDFVVIPAGMLLANISGRPMFLNDPTYPHDGIITLAHCTGPRKMDGKTVEPARILTHFESDYGAAPKVEMRKGQAVTNIIPDFKARRWVTLSGEIVEVPFLPICRDQIDIRFACDSLKLAEAMPGFHWITCYGEYCREVHYAAKRAGIEVQRLG